MKLWYWSQNKDGVQEIELPTDKVFGLKEGLPWARIHNIHTYLFYSEEEAVRLLLKDLRRTSGWIQGQIDQLEAQKAGFTAKINAIEEGVKHD